MANIKYLTPEQQVIVTNDLKTMPTDKLLQLKDMLNAGGLKTCVRLIEEELTARLGSNI